MQGVIFYIGLGGAILKHPFGFGLSYNEDDNGVANNGDTSIFVVGADYKYDDYTFGVSYFDRSDDQNSGRHTTASGIEVNRLTGGVQYNYGPGMSIHGAVSYIEAESELAGDAERSGYQIAVGTAIFF